MVFGSGVLGSGSPTNQPQDNFQYAENVIKQADQRIKQIHAGDLPVGMVRRQIAYLEEAADELEASKTKLSAEHDPRTVKTVEHIDAEMAVIAKEVDSLKRVLPTYQKMKVRPSSRLFFDVHASPLGKETQMRANNPRTVLGFVIPYIDARPQKSPRMEQALKELKIAERLTDLEQEDFISEMQKLITAGERFVWPGGWIGTPMGHQIYCEYIPDAAGKGFLRFYNLGAGSQEHDIAGKKSVPFLEWQIESEKLHDKNTLQAIWEVKKCLTTKSGDKTNYKSEEVYGVLRSILKPTETALKEGELPPLLKSQQEGNNCTWKSLCAFLATILSPSEYKEFITDVKIDTVYEEALDPNLSLSQDQAETLTKRAIEHTASYVTKQHLRGIISDQQAYVAEVRLKEANAAVQLRGHYRHMISTDRPEWQNIYMQWQLMPDASKAGGAAITGAQTVSIDSIRLINDMQPLNRGDYQDAVTRFEKVTTILKSHDWRNEGFAIHKALFDFMLALPLDKPEQMTQTEARQILSFTKDIADIYFRAWASVAQNNVANQEREFIFRKIWNLQSHLNSIAFNLEDGVMFRHFTDKTPHSIQSIFSWSPLGKEVKKQDEFLIEKLHHKISYPGSWGDDIRAERLELVPGTSNILKVLDLPEYTGLLSLDPIASDTYNFAEFLNHIGEMPKELQAQFTTMNYLYAIENRQFLPTAVSLNEQDFQFKFSATVQSKRADHGIVEKTLPATSKGVPETSLYVDPQFYEHNYPFQLSDYRESSLVCIDESVPAAVKSTTKETKDLLFRLFGATNTGLNDLLAYCQENPSVIYDSKFRALFLGLLLVQSPTVLSPDRHELYTAVNMEEWLIAKFDLVASKATEDTSTAVFIMRALRYIRCNYQDDAMQHLPFPVIEKCEQLLKTAQGSLSGQQAVYAELITHLGDQAVLSSKETLLFAKAVAFLNKNPMDKASLDPKWAFEIDKAKLRHAEHICKSCTPPFINEIIKTVYPSWKDVDDWTTIQDGRFISYLAKASYDPLDGSFSAQSMNRLPRLFTSAMQSNKEIQALFPNVKEGTYVHGESVHPFYEFIDPTTQRKSRIYENGTIEQDIPGYGTCTYFRDPVRIQVSEKSPTSLQSSNITQNFHHWKTNDDLFILNESLDARQIIYKTRINTRPDQWHPYSIEELSTGYLLSKPSKLFSQIEHPSYIEQWHDGASNVRKIALPRLGLNFEVDGRDPNHLLCKEYPDFYIDLNTQTPYPISHFHRGIVITNGKETKYLLPRFEFKTPAEPDVLGPENEVDYKAQENPAQNSIKVYAYDLHAKGLSAKSKEAEMYLASVYALSQNYAEAFAILKKERAQIVSYAAYPELGKALQTIVNIEKLTGNRDANTAALGAFAGYLLWQNNLMYGTKVECGEQISDCYERFLQKQTQSHIVAFEKGEELFLIKKTKPTRRKQQRLGILTKLATPVSPQTLTRTKARPESLPKSLKTGEMRLKVDARVADEPNLSLSDLMISRPEVRKHFKTYVKWAMSDDVDKKKWLMTSMQFLLGSEAGHFLDKPPAALIYSLAAKTESFDPLPEDDKDFTTWLTKQHDTASRLAEDLPAALPQAKIEVEIPSEKYPTLPPPLEPLSKKLDFVHARSPQTVSEKTAPFISVGEKAQLELRPLHGMIQAGLASDDPMLKKKYQELDKSFQVYAQSKPTNTYSITDLAELKTALKPTVSRLPALEHDILSIANNQPVTLDTLRGQFKPFTIDELKHNFAKQKPELLQQRNPHLNAQQLSQIYAKLSEYLLTARVEQQNNRAIDAIRDLEKLNDPDEIKMQEQAIAEICAAKMEYDVKGEFGAAFLVFEVAGDLSLRPQQIEKLKRFLITGDPNEVVEMIMGSGKSKVLLPLLSALRANGNNISSTITGPQFFHDVAPHAVEAIQTSYDQTMKTLYFERGTPTTEESLSNILTKLKTIQSNQDSLITTSKSLQSLQLSFIEEWSKCISDASATAVKEMPKELETFGEIITVLRTQQTALMDEADTLLDVNHSVSSSRGVKTALPSEQLEIISHIYHLLYTEPALRVAALDSDPFPVANQSLLTETRYKEELKSKLAEKLLKDLPNIHFTDLRVREAAAKIADRDQVPLLDFICQEPNWTDVRRQAAQKAFDTLPEDVKPLISLAGLMVSVFLERTLTKIHGEKYMSHPSSDTAIPCKAAKTPSIGSEFNAYISLCLTIQARVKEGLTTAEIKEKLDKMAKNLEDPDYPDKAALMVVYKKWQQKLDSNLNITKKEDWEALAKKINATSQDRLEFIDDFILPDLKFYTKKISSDPHDLVDMCANPTGFTGTMGNAPTFHYKLKAVPELGDDIKTLAILMSQFKKPAMVVKEDPQTMLEAFHEFDMICDLGGNFKALENEDVAKKMAVGGKKVVFYKEGKQMITDGVKTSAFNAKTNPRGSYLTFLDQINTTGADVPQRPLATSVVTVRKGVLVRDILQAVWRLRGLDKGQSIQWAVSEEMEKMIRSDLKLPDDIKIGFPEIIRYAIANDAKMLSESDPLSFKQQLNNVKKQVLIEVLLSGASFETKQQALKAFLPAWITSDAVDPVKQFGKVMQLIPAEDMIAGHAEETRKFLKAHCAGNVLNNALQKVDGIEKHFSKPGMIPAKVPEPAISVDDTVEVEKESEKEVEQEITVETEKSGKQESIELQYITGDALEDVKPVDGQIVLTKDKIPCVSLNEYLQTQKSPLSNDFDGIDISINFLERRKVRPKPEDLSSYKMYDQNQKAFDYMIIERDRIKLISHEDAQTLSKDPRITSNIFSLKSGRFPFNSKRKLTEAETTQLIPVKFLAGISNVTKEERPLYKNWIQSHNPKTLRTSFEKTILRTPALESKKRVYKNSDLIEIFEELRGASV